LRNVISPSFLNKSVCRVNGVYRRKKLKYMRAILCLIFVLGIESVSFASKFDPHVGFILANCPNDPNTEFFFKQDVSYLAPNRAEKMDIYTPNTDRGQDCFPAVLIIHGGGWIGGDKASMREKQIAYTLVKAGYVVFSINYQLAKYTKKNGKVEKWIIEGWPQNIYDCKTAVRYIRKNAHSLGVDPNQIGIMGSSAGGHLALLTALSANDAELNMGGLYGEFPSDVKCVVDLYGIPDVNKFGAHIFERTPNGLEKASPVNYLSASTPPILIIHGDKDATVNINLSKDFVDTLRLKSIIYEFAL
jgi:acetyl esterase/lipase